MSTIIFDALYSKDDFLKPVYFSMEVLERYFKNPQYKIFYTDYRGRICLKDEYTSDDFDDYEEIKNFGIAYHKKNKYKKVIVTFADNLVKLPIKIQGVWYTYLLENQEEYIPNEGFVKNLIYGKWVDNISLYQALLMEMHYINEMCKAMKLKPMFNQEYRFDTSNMDDRPLHYHNILLPTRDSYYNFVITLEKLVVSNLNCWTFTDTAHLVNGIERKREDETPKGTLVMLKEWFEKNVSGVNIEEDIIIPLKKLRELRQIPAHKLYQNDYDEIIWKDQEDILNNTYIAVRQIRLLLANHPLTKIVEIPDVLFSENNIVSY